MNYPYLDELRVERKKCSFKFHFGEAYTTCQGDHSLDEHNADDMRAFTAGIQFSVGLLEADLREQGEASRVREIERALSMTVETLSPKKDT